LLQISLSWNDYASWPYLQIRSGSGDVLSIIFWVYKFGIDIDLMGRTWSWDYLENIEIDTSLDDVDPTIGLTE
jgi:hypothetical protein